VSQDERVTGYIVGVSRLFGNYTVLVQPGDPSQQAEKDAMVGVRAASARWIE
jgi:hypothetical protein